jgi:hypothetical protein
MTRSPFPPDDAPLIVKLSAMRHGLTFATCLAQCAADSALVANYDRLRGTNLSQKGSGLLLEIDRVTGRLESELRDFVDFCWTVVFKRFG